MAKTTRPDRRRGSGRKREASEFEETTLSVDRVTRVVAGGRRLRFRAVVVIGNKKGKVGLGTGKASEVQSAVKKAAADARRRMIRVPIRDGTIPHEINVKYKAARIRLLPAAEGTGIIAGGALRTVLENAGVRNVLSKRFGSSNKLVNAQAVMLALQKLRGTIVESPALKPAGEQRGGVAGGGRRTTEGAVLTEADQDAEALKGESTLAVQEISRQDIDKEGNLRKRH